MENPSIEQLQSKITLLTRELFEAKRAQQEAERAKKEYMQNVAHQLTAPLNAVKMNIEALTYPKISMDRRQVLLRSIYSQGTIVVHLIKNFSLMSHLEGDHDLNAFREDPEDVDLYKLSTNLCNDFQPVGKAKDQKILTNESDFAKMGYPHLFTIKNLITQVVYNLLENATKYADGDSTIQVRLLRDNGDKVLVVESVGLPIEQSEISKVFERGYRGKTAKPKNPAGTGFGLFIARRIMQILGGELWVVPQGRVSRFHVLLPKGSAK
ncbi:MAG: sensor histidine kinase [Acidobacteriota bacterium]